MAKLAALVAVTGAACAANNQNLERKLDDLTAQLATTRHELTELRLHVDQLATPPQPADDRAALDRRLDELNRKLDAIASRPPPARPPRPEPDRMKVYAVPIDGYPAQGPSDAKITMVIAHDYADPFSERVRGTLDELRRKYGHDLRIVYRNLVVHPHNATAAALASCAAAKQGKFDALDDVLWEQGFKARRFDLSEADAGPRCWSTPAGCANAIAFARQARLDMSRFKADMMACEADVAADQKELQAFGLGATPSFFINGRFLLGAQPTETFMSLIDEELAKADERNQAGTPKAQYYKTWVLGKGLARLEQP